MNAPTYTGDLDLARHLLREDSFLDGHTGLDAREYCGEEPSEPGTTSVHLNGEVVEALLLARGWKFECRYPARGKAWWAPDGQSFAWGRDEALTLALTAEAC